MCGDLRTPKCQYTLYNLYQNFTKRPDSMIFLFTIAFDLLCICLTAFLKNLI